MTIKQLLAMGEKVLANRYGVGPEARMLLAYVLGAGDSYLLAHGEEEVAAAPHTTYLAYLQRAQRGEPIPYILGAAPFFDLRLKVTPAVLIPRPETEQLVELVMAWAKRRPQPDLHLVDVGTGSGCIAITLARKLPQTHITAIDVSPAALAVAQENARTYGVAQQIDFYEGDLLTPLTRPISLIVANLPYVTDGEWTQLDDGVKSYEPELALRGGQDGLTVVRRLLEQAKTRLLPSGAIFLEIGWQQGAAAVTLAQQLFPEATGESLPDYAGHDRFVYIQL
ncbi:MAG: peptide chain release factor N(5)-glutamine methyltransferase [Anaerolineae bacterium]|nr:peptide chain release factor N(5)-glutamine methyltransferase [Anaerolineae bacterium]